MFVALCGCGCCRPCVCSVLLKVISTLGNAAAIDLTVHRALIDSQVVKLEGTKRQERICKLTADSVLVLEGNKIKKETHYAGLERVWLDAADATLLWMKYKVRQTAHSRCVPDSRVTGSPLSSHLRALRSLTSL